MLTTLDSKTMRFGTVVTTPNQLLSPTAVDASFLEEEALLQHHLAIFGGTRSGKSKLIEQICRQLILNNSGFAYIDPPGDTADDVFAYVACHQESLGVIPAKTIYLNPARMLFSFDPFDYQPSFQDLDEDDFLPFGIAPNTDPDFLYHCWLFKRVNAMADVILRMQGQTHEEQQKMVLLKRWLQNGLYAIGVRQPDGTRLRFSDLFILLNPAHPRHNDLYSQVERWLPDMVRGDFEELRAMNSPYHRSQLTQSTFNHLRHVCSPIFNRIFNLEAPTIDFRRIVQNGEILLVSMTDDHDLLARETAQAIAGLLILQLSSAVKVTPEKRSQYYLFIDEAQNYLGEDLLYLLREGAKYKIGLGLAVQGLDNLQRENLDLVPPVLNNCGLRITFQQSDHEQAEILVKSLCAPLMEFNELRQAVDRDNGYIFPVIASVSESVNWSETDSHGAMSSDTTGQSSGTGTGESHNASRAQISDWMSGQVEQLSQATSDGTTHSVFESSLASNTSGHSNSHSKSKGGSNTVTYTPTPLHQTREEVVRTGKLEQAVPDQIARLTNVVQRLPAQHCLVSIKMQDRCFVLRVADVFDPALETLQTARGKRRAMKRLLQRMVETHPFYFTPKPQTASPMMSGMNRVVPRSDSPNGRKNRSTFLPSE